MYEWREHPEMDWLINSLRYIDFDYDCLIKECAKASFWTKGGFNYEALSNMEYKQYELVIQEANRIEKIFLEESKQ